MPAIAVEGIRSEEDGVGKTISFPRPGAVANSVLLSWVSSHTNLIPLVRLFHFVKVFAITICI